MSEKEFAVFVLVLICISVITMGGGVEWLLFMCKL